MRGGGVRLPRAHGGTFRLAVPIQARVSRNASPRAHGGTAHWRRPSKPADTPPARARGHGRPRSIQRVSRNASRARTGARLRPSGSNACLERLPRAHGGTLSALSPLSSPPTPPARARGHGTLMVRRGRYASRARTGARLHSVPISPSPYASRARTGARPATRATSSRM